MRKLHTTRNLARTKISMEQDYSTGNKQTTDFIFERCQKTGKHSIPSKRQTGEKQKSV
jgi:hypothetical protein